MSNEEVARVFREMADLVRIDAGEPHRAKAFERTAEILESLTEPASELLRFGRLAKVKGIGPGSVDRIKEVLRTGTCAEHKLLRAKIPAGLREVLDLRDVGPALVRQLWQTLGVTDLASLEAALTSGRLTRVPGIGPRTVELITQSLAHEKLHVTRLLLPEALELGEQLRSRIERLPACLRAFQVGSARRREETVGDLDFVATSLDSALLVRQFAELPAASEVLLRAPTRGSVRFPDGRQADLWVVPPECIGAALHAFSGRKPHVVEIRKRANKRGLHLSEFGIVRGGTRIAPGTREEEIFAAVDLPFIEPELRQALGEIEAAEKGRLPVLLDIADLVGDTRMRALDDEKQLRAALQAARGSGRRWVILHVLDERSLAKQGERLRALGDEVGIEVLVGLLATVAGAGEPSLSRESALAADWITLWNDAAGDAEQRTARVERAFETGLIDALACPLGRTSIQGALLPLDIERVVRAARKHEVALELHADPTAYDLDARACRLARDSGVMVAVATGANSVDEVGWMRWGAYQARRGWLSSKDVLNSLSAEELLARRVQRLGVERPAVESKARAAKTKRSRSKAAVTDAQVSEVEAGDGAEVTKVQERLAKGDVDDALLERLERWLREGSDDILERALAGLGGNPMQKAFELTMLARSSRGS